MSNELKSLLEQRNYWKSHAKSISQNLNNSYSQELSEANEKYKYFRNRANNKKKYDEKLYKSRKFEECKDSPQKTWNYAKSIMHWTSSGPPSQLIINNQIIRKASQIACEMN